MDQEEAEIYPLDVQGSSGCQDVWWDSEDLPDIQHLIPPGSLAGGQLWWLLGKAKSWAIKPQG